MQNLHIPATSYSPQVDFDFARHQLSLRGESYERNIVGVSVTGSL